jgi:hypothetical protein
MWAWHQTRPSLSVMATSWALTALMVAGIIVGFRAAVTFVRETARVDRGATYALTALVVAHVLLAAGILPGYRGAWRAMHLRGRTPVATAPRLWPATVQAPGDEDPPVTR